MRNPFRVPRLLGEPLYIPFVGAIIERSFKGKKQVVVQTRKKMTDPKYSGSLEIPGGKFRAFEDIYDTLAREVKEECGLEVVSVLSRDKRVAFKNRDDVSELVYPFCVTQMANGPFIGLIFICEAKGDLLLKTNETKDSRWIDFDELKEIVSNHPDKIYTAFLAPLKKYVGQG